jgi:hypothetical protein
LGPFTYIAELVAKPYLTPQDEALAQSNLSLAQFLSNQFEVNAEDIENYRLTKLSRNYEHAVHIAYSPRESMAAVISYRVSR